MKTKDFIKMLQEVDPTGEAHIRMQGGVPCFAELKEGYWDGPYSYIDEQGNYNYTTEEMKVDIHCTDINDFVYNNVDIHNKDNWNNIKSKFIFNLGYSIKEQREEREEAILKEAKECFEEITDILNKHYQESIN